MSHIPAEDFARRQEQWDAFHRWESSRQEIDMPLDQRIAWYIAAYRFSKRYSPQCLPGHIGTKVWNIRKARERLAHLTGT